MSKQHPKKNDSKSKSKSKRNSFSFRPTHSADIDIFDTYKQPLFTRNSASSFHADDYDDSPLPTSALPYIYTDTDDHGNSDIVSDDEHDHDEDGYEDGKVKDNSKRGKSSVHSRTSSKNNHVIQNATDASSPLSAVSTSIYPPMYSPTNTTNNNNNNNNNNHSIHTNRDILDAHISSNESGISSVSNSHCSTSSNESIYLPTASDTYKAATLTQTNSNLSNLSNDSRSNFSYRPHDVNEYKNMNSNSNSNSNQAYNNQAYNNDPTNKQRWKQHSKSNQTRNKSPLPPSLLDQTFSVRITTSQSRNDPSGASYTVYILCIETKNNKRYNIEHRYSEFAKLNEDLKANDIMMESPFPFRHWAGRIGDWTPASRWAPEKNKEMIREREQLLDIWMVELCELFQHTNRLHGELRAQVDSFFRNSSMATPPCDRVNHVAVGLFLKEEDVMIEYDGEARHSGGGIVTKHLGNPLSFTLGSSIRQAAYNVMRMCGTKSTYTLMGNSSDQLIPLDLLHQAKGLVFLTVAKAGLVVSIRCGTGLVIAKRRDGTWTPPSAIGTLGMGWGAVIGGDITTYLIVLNTVNAVKVFAQKRSINLGAELGVAVGPLGRCANGNLNADSSGRIVPAYAYAHSKGLFAGISLEGSVVGCRPDVNAKFYGKSLDASDLLFEHIQPRPLAAQPLYDALNEAMSLEVPKNGFRPSRAFQQRTACTG